jgi:hypothetical protein
VVPEGKRDKPLELWWQDEARIGRQGTLTRVWGCAATVRRRHVTNVPIALIFGAVCPTHDVGAARMLSQVSAEAMNLHLAEISRLVSPGSYAVVVLDVASWHQTGGKLCIPDNISLLAPAAMHLSKPS